MTSCVAYTKCIAALCYDLIYLFVYLFIYLFIYLSTRVERLSRGLVSTAQYRVIFSSDRITSKTQTRLGLRWLKTVFCFFESYRTRSDYLGYELFCFEWLC